jgi:hypothetical protein
MVYKGTVRSNFQGHSKLDVNVTHKAGSKLDSLKEKEAYAYMWMVQERRENQSCLERLRSQLEKCAGCHT